MTALPPHMWMLWAECKAQMKLMVVVRLGGDIWSSELEGECSALPNGIVLFCTADCKEPGLALFAMRRFLARWRWRRRPTQ
jgi:hypothetical protein